MKGWPTATLTLLTRRSGGTCEALATARCTGQATDGHHRQRRREGNDTITNALHLCRPCHSWAHAHPTRARLFGWIVSAWAHPAEVPVHVHGRRVLLTPDGGLEPAPDEPLSLHIPEVDFPRAPDLHVPANPQVTWAPVARAFDTWPDLHRRPTEDQP